MAKTHPLIDLLHQAVENLEEYNALIKKEQAKQSQSFFSRILFKIRALWRKPQEEHYQLRERVIQSSEELKKHFNLIEKLKKGSEPERRFAQMVTEAIKQFNHNIERAETQKRTLTDRVEKFVEEQSGFPVPQQLLEHKITVPSTPTFRYSSSEESILTPEDLPQELTLEKITAFLQPTVSEGLSLTKQETDIFRMKTISIANQSELPDSLSKALKTLMWEEPIELSSSEESIISLVQTLSPFPGETITVRGKFKRDNASIVPTVPIQESFSVSSHSSQKGFPHPSQLYGWSLCDECIPTLPNRIDQLPLFSALFQRKQGAAESLLPHGKWNTLAKVLLKQKKEIFHTHRKLLLEKHHKLLQLLFKGLSTEPIDTFFDYLYHDPLAFKHITHAYDLANTFFLSHIFHKTNDAWIDHQDDRWRSKDTKIRLEVCLEVMKALWEQSHFKLQTQIENTPPGFEKAFIDFILHLGNVLKTYYQPIFLLFLSEKVGFPPPLLKQKEHRMFVCAFRHLIYFLDECESNSEVSIESISSIIDGDYYWFLEEKEDSITTQAIALANELEAYYNSRFYKN